MPQSVAAVPALVCVDPARVAEIWPHVAPLVAAALARGGDGDLAAVECALARGRALLWLAWDGKKILAAAVTEVARLHGETLCTILACGGKGFDRFGALIAGLERYARAEGCARMRIAGRRGWARVLRDYRVKSVVIEKDLSRPHPEEHARSACVSKDGREH